MRFFVIGAGIDKIPGYYGFCTAQPTPKCNLCGTSRYWSNFEYQWLRAWRDVFLPQFISGSASIDAVTAMCPGVTVMGQWSYLVRHNVPMYSCYYRVLSVQSPCDNESSSLSWACDVTGTSIFSLWNSMKRYNKQALTLSYEYILCYCKIDAIELGLACFTTQIDLLPNTANLVDVARDGSWNSLSKIRLSAVHIT